MSIIPNVDFDVQHKSNKVQAFKGVHSSGVGVDLMIVDIPKGLPVPIVSSPTTSVPSGMQW
jgi:hypothetical protein